MEKVLKFLKKKSVLWTGLGLVVLVVLITAFGGNGNGENTVVVARKDVVQGVEVTGKTKADQEVELSFDNSGRIAHVYAPVGSKVYVGQVLAELDTSSQLANLASQKALLSEEQKNLADEGERIEGSLRQAYSSADNAVRNKIDQFYKTPRTNPSFEVKFADGNFVHYFDVPSDTTFDLNNTRKSIETLLLNWQSELFKLTSDNAKTYAASSIEKMNTISNFLDKVAYAVNSFTPGEFTYNSTVALYKTDVDSARGVVSTARKNLIDANSAGAEKVAQRQSEVDASLAALAKSRILAPFSGTVTRQDAKVGEVAQSQQSLVTLISLDNMYVEANVSEVNIGKVKVGDRVEVTFDAYAGESWTGTITFIDPGETIVDKVVNYKVRTELDKNLNVIGKIKSGLTANVKIATASSTDALSIPIYATTKEGDKVFVNKLVNGKPVKTEITLGLMGSDGSVEILSGLSEGEIVDYNK